MLFVVQGRLVCEHKYIKSLSESLILYIKGIMTLVAVVCVIQLDICVYLKKHGIYFNDHWSLNGITSTNHLHGHFNLKVKPVKILLPSATKFAKVMFLQVCVFPQVGGWYPSMPCNRSPRGGQCLLRGCLLLGGGSGGGGDPPPADGYCCGRYASYWNAFLLMNKINLISKVNDLGTRNTWSRNTWSSIDSFSKLSFIKY